MKTAIIVIAICFAYQITSYSQEDSASNFSVGADLVSRYVWRGNQLSNSPAFQPTLAFSKGNFTIGAWGSYTFANEPDQEADLFISYSIGKLNISVNDYFYVNESADYFDWDKETTSHALEGIVTFDGPEALPFQLVAGLFFYGADQDTLGENYYSSYFELNRTWEAGSCSVKPFIGVSPVTSYYSEDGFQVVNLGITVSKSLSVGSLNIPVNASFITNPHKKNVFMTCGITF